MVTVRDLIKTLEYLVSLEDLNYDDKVYVVGSGDKKTKALSGICFPKVTVSEEALVDDEKGYYNLGFVDND